MKNSYCIYKHTFPDGKVYIGMTCQQPEKRWRNGNGYSRDKEMHDAIMAVGWDNIQHEILESGLNRYEARREERRYVQLFHSTDKERGYNHVLGVEKKKVKEYTDNGIEPLKRRIKAHYEAVYPLLGCGLPPAEKILHDFPPDYPTDGYEDIIRELMQSAIEVCIDKDRYTIKADMEFYVWLYTKKMFEAFMFLCQTEGRESAIRMMKIEI